MPEPRDDSDEARGEPESSNGKEAEGEPESRDSTAVVSRATAQQW